MGLFIALGGAVAVALIMWAKGSAMRKGSPYQATIEFPLACGITIGTPVRIRGVPVGNVLNVKPSLDRVDVLVEINDMATVIPRNSVIEANQSGLIAEPLVDITPQLPLPQYTAGPLDAACQSEAMVVCANGHIKGQQVGRAGTGKQAQALSTCPCCALLCPCCVSLCLGAPLPVFACSCRSSPQDPTTRMQH